MDDLDIVIAAIKDAIGWLHRTDTVEGQIHSTLEMVIENIEELRQRPKPMTYERHVTEPDFSRIGHPCKVCGLNGTNPIHNR
jgi:hypothetical protein